MLWVKCIKKIRNNNNIITDYEIADLKGEHRVVSKDALKNAISNNQVSVVNLKLTTDGKLMDRSTEEQGRLMKELSLGIVTEKDDRMYSKARILDAAPVVDERGNTVGWPDIETIWITPNVKMITSNNKLADRTLIFNGNNEVKFGTYEYYNKAIIRNPTLVTAVAKQEFTASTIVFDFDGMDLKLLDIIFKVFKEDETLAIQNSTHQYTNILLEKNRIPCNEAYAKVEQILKRQKPSTHYDRRCYDLVAYLRLIYSMYLSYGDKSIFKYTDEYIDEYKSKQQLAPRHSSTRFLYFLSSNLNATISLISNIESSK